MKLTMVLYRVRDHHHIQHVREGPSFSTDIYDFLINWQGEHLAGRRVGCSQLLPAVWLCYYVGVSAWHGVRE